MGATKIIWLINPYGPIPGEEWRDYRFTLIAKSLVEEGYAVVWWTSSFSHHFKRQRCVGWEDRKISDLFTVRLVPSPSYRKNLGMGRVWRDLVFGWRAYGRGLKESKPDLIFFSESPLTFGFAGYRLARKHKTKMIFDQMDVWPEVIEKVLNPAMLLASRPVFAAIYSFRKRSYGQLHGSCALATPYLEVMHRVAPELIGRPSCVAYNGIDVSRFRRLMSDRDLGHPTFSKPHGFIWAIFAGSLGETYDIRTILQAATILERKRSKIMIVVAGDGPLRGEVTRYANQESNGRLLYLGKVAPEQLAKIYGFCDIGLCAYSINSNVEMPDKIYDYTAAGLAVLNSLTGEVCRVVHEKQIGEQYEAGSPNDMATKLLSLEGDPTKLSLYRHHSHELGESFDQTNQLLKISNLIREVI